MFGLKNERQSRDNVQRYFVSNQQQKEDVFQIIGDDYHHIIRVMRMVIGDKIICVTPEQKSAICQITKITAESVHASVVQWNHVNTELPIQITIASGLPKADKLEFVIQKGTELGAYEFIPFLAARSITKWDEKKAQKRVARLQKIAKEAAEQSHRHLLPTVHQPLTMKKLIAHSKDYQHKLIAFEEDAKSGEKSTFAHILSTVANAEALLIVFGPEGGLTEGEVEQLKAAGFLTCGLGPRILRTETAPLYALAAASYQLELLR